MKISPAMIPQRIDCGFRNTVFMSRSGPHESVCCRGLGFRFRKEEKQEHADRQAADAHGDPERAPGDAGAITGPTRNWPAEPPAMPNIWVAPIRVAAREAGKLVVAM